MTASRDAIPRKQNVCVPSRRSLCLCANFLFLADEALLVDEALLHYLLVETRFPE